MNEKVNFYFGDIVKNEFGVSDASINLLMEQIGFKLPQDYIDLMKEYDGGEGEVGENGWLCLFPIEDLLTINKDYDLVMEQIPEYFLFGKDAADTGYAFYKPNQSIHSFGLMSNFNTDPIQWCAKSFVEFAEYLYNQ
jgi:SMI1 / KNR4 family (SUKH-1)